MCDSFFLINFICLIGTLSWIQSNAGSGAINITCDAWQASNTDGYFAVTGHWIEEVSPMQWECKSTLLRFTQVNNAHSGKQLSGALFKVLDQVGVTHKVFQLHELNVCAHRNLQLGHVTCDNATNNRTMLGEVARLYDLRYQKEFPWRERKIKQVAISFSTCHISHGMYSCLSHIINLGSQALISTYSKSPHYAPHDLKAHEPDTWIHGNHDEIGLIHAICVKVSHCLLTAFRVN